MQVVNEIGNLPNPNNTNPALAAEVVEEYLRFNVPQLLPLPPPGTWHPPRIPPPPGLPYPALPTIRQPLLTPTSASGLTYLPMKRSTIAGGGDSALPKLCYPGYKCHAVKY